LSASQSSREQRLAQLLDTIRTHPTFRWTTGFVHEMRRRSGGPPQRNTARWDLVELHRRGHLVEHGPKNDRSYTLRTRKDRA
jgi:trehalose-6-phosphate synthase